MVSVLYYLKAVHWRHELWVVLSTGIAASRCCSSLRYSASCSAPALLEALLSMGGGSSGASHSVSSW